MSAVDAAVSALFINSGILGRRTFAEFVRTAFERECDGVSFISTAGRRPTRASA